MAALEKAYTDFSPFLCPGYNKSAHITLYAAGFLASSKAYSDNVSHEQLTQQKALIQQQFHKPFNLTSRGLNSFPGSLFIEVLDQYKQLDYMRAPLISRFSNDRAVTYRPHLTIGLYCNAFPVASIAERINAYASCIAENTLEVKRIGLYRYRADELASPLELMDAVYPRSATMA